MEARRKILSTILQNKRLSDFEKKVYIATLGIKSGEVRSYKWVAMKIRRPKAYRVVGNVLAKNPYPGTVPCHRVIKSDGSIGGYYKGARLKRSLLESEKVDSLERGCYNLNKTKGQYGRRT